MKSTCNTRTWRSPTISRRQLLGKSLGPILLALSSCGLGLGVPLQAQASPAYIQDNQGVPPQGGFTVTVPYTSAQQAGDLNVVIVSNSVPISVSDSVGNMYVVAAGPTSVRSGGPGSSSYTETMYYAVNIRSAAANANTVTVTLPTGLGQSPVKGALSSSGPSVSVTIAEYSGIAALDGTAAATGTGTSASSGPVSTTNANDLLVGALAPFTITRAGKGYTVRSGSTIEDENVTATGSYSATATSSGGPWIMQLAAFKAGSGSSGGSPCD